nr:hypothetical protein [Endozoicomonas numazuensis]
MTTKKKRKIHSPEFKAEALKLAEKTSVSSAAKETRAKRVSTLYTHHIPIAFQDATLLPAFAHPDHLLLVGSRASFT